MTTLVYVLAGAQRQRTCGSALDDLAQALQHIEAELLKAGHVATHFVVDGAEIEPDTGALAARLANHQQSDLTISIQSAPARQVAVETAQSAVDYMAHLLTQLPALAQQLYGGDLPADFHHVVEGLVWITNYVQVGYPLLASGHARRPGATTLSRRLGEAIAEFEPALANRDLTLLADVLLEDMGPVIEEILRRTKDATGWDTVYG